MKEITYLIYIIVFETLIWGGTGYAVFFLGRSGWWFLLALIVSSAAYSPYHWGIDGANPSKPKILEIKGGCDESKD